ncbi:MAG: ribbon-helix-helix domain-containing protein [Pseudolabrys sp.]|nr:ribbon-helix-helix domain-containing protein [Pseudolabrys sp.]MDP2295714.1 ribbon-helix-helix domain-containing protein [Pseudolabrys sp.]
MKSTITKRSVVIAGHKTSVSLEEPFWNAVRDITEARATTVSALLHEIDSGRTNANLSSAVRVFVLEYVRQNGIKARLEQDATRPNQPDKRENAA